jgi:hypothetical protein
MKMCNETLSLFLVNRKSFKEGTLTLGDLIIPESKRGGQDRRKPVVPRTLSV